MILNVFLSIVETFLLFAVGALALRFRYIIGDDIGRWSKLAFNVFTPCLTFNAIVKNIAPETLATLWVMPATGFLMMMTGAGLGMLFRPLLRHRNPARLATFLHVCGINNYIFLPFIVLVNIFGYERHVALLLVMNVGSTIGFWTVGVMTLTGIRRDSLRQAARQVFSINVIAVGVALLVLLLGIPVPRMAMNLTGTLGDLTIPLTVILTGAALCRDAGGLLKNKSDVLVVSLVRLILIPLIFIGLLKLIPLPRDIYEVCFIVSLMPAAVSSALVARLYGGDGEFASQSVVATTLLALGTIPLLLMLM